MVYVSIPAGNLPTLPPTLMIGSNSALRGSNIGSKKKVLEMLELAVKAKVENWIEIMPMAECVDAIERVEKGEHRYRVVLEEGK